MQNQNPSIFFVYYCTIKGDALGKLIFKENEIIFEPFNENFKGFLNQEKEDFFNNIKLQTSISYFDISNNPIIIPAPDKSETKIPKLNYFIEIECFHTGYYYYTDNESKKIIDSCRENNKNLASIFLKISSNNLFGEEVMDNIRLENANKIINLIKEKKKNTKLENITKTNIPYFDINYSFILEHITKKKIKEIKEEEKIYYIQKNLLILEKFFGFKMMNKNLTNINNQSLISLDYVFPDTKKVKNYENEELFSKIIKKETQDNLKSNKSIEMLGKINKYNSSIHPILLSNESCIINNEKAYLIDHFLPHYLKGLKWKLLYSRANDGTSYNTLKRNSFNKGELIILIKDQSNKILGGFSNESLNINSNFYGTRETFIFNFTDTEINVFNSTFNNNYFIFSDEDGFGFGSVDHYGLFINKSLKTGSSHPCETFNNTCLSYNNHFNINKIEIWGFNTEKDFLYK